MSRLHEAVGPHARLIAWRGSLPQAAQAAEESLAWSTSGSRAFDPDRDKAKRAWVLQDLRDDDERSYAVVVGSELADLPVWAVVVWKDDDEEAEDG